MVMAAAHSLSFLAGARDAWRSQPLATQKVLMVCDQSAHACPQAVFTPHMQTSHVMAGLSSDLSA